MQNIQKVIKKCIKPNENQIKNTKAKNPAFVMLSIFDITKNQVVIIDFNL